MLPPLETGILNALVRDGDDAGSWMVRLAKNCLNINRNLSLGVHMLLSTYGPFLAQLYQDKAPLNSNMEDDDSWNIEFRGPPFDDLSIHSTSVEGVIDVHVLNKPFISIFMLDKPQNWQALLQWLWEHGNKREIARSIPQLDPQTLRALVDENYSKVESDQMNTGDLTDSQVRDDDLSIRIARKSLATGDIAGGLYEALVTFQIFKPSLRQSKPSPSHAGVGYQKWRIYFLVSPFRSFHLQPSQIEGVVDLYAFGKQVKSFQLTNSPRSWQVIFESLRDYGNKRHLEKADYEARHPQSISKAKSKGKRPRAETPLLHHVLRTAGFKAQGESKMKLKEVEYKPKAADSAVDSGERKAVRRLALHPASPNKRMGKSRLTTCTTADEVDANLTPKGRA